MRVASCPPAADLERLFLGGLSEQEALVLEEHVLTCNPCLQQLKSLVRTQDTLADQLRAGNPPRRLRAQPRGCQLDEPAQVIASSVPACPVPAGPVMKTLTCPACQKKLAVKESLTGKKIKCPGCSKILLVPAPTGVAVRPKKRALPPNPAPASTAKRPTHSGADLLDATLDNQASDPGPDASLTDFLAPPQAADELGRLGKYRILKVLGHGGMGVVFKAEDPLLKRHVALKAMLPTLAASASAGKRFLREAQAMAAVEHDHIVRVYQVDEERGVPFLAMEFLKGEPLDERLKREDAAADPGGGADRPGDRRGAGGGPRTRADPPRHQAGQHLAGSARRARQDPGLRPGALGGAGGRPDAAGGDHRHAGLHGSRAGPRRRRGCPLRPVQPGGAPLPALLRAAGLPAARTPSPP